MSQIVVKLYIFFTQKLANGGKTLQKVPEKHCNENGVNLNFNVMKAIFRAPGAVIKDNMISEKHDVFKELSLWSALQDDDTICLFGNAL